MDRRIIAVAAGFAVMVLAGAQPVQAGQCETKCDQSFSACNGSNPDTSKCLPSWGQCKRACSGPVKTAAPVKAVTPAPKPLLTKVAGPKAKPPGPTNKAKPGN